MLFKTLHMTKKLGGLGFALTVLVAAAAIPGGRVAEADFTTPPQCNDGIDNDGDGTCDFAGCTINGVPLPPDPGCDSPNDNDETDLNFSPAIKARIAIIFDTSGSLLDNICCDTTTGGDGTVECPGKDVACPTRTQNCNNNGGVCQSVSCGNGVADDSRIYKLKAGLSGAVAAYGEVEWSLFRFHQKALAFACPATNGNNGQDGGWQGASSTCVGNNCGRGEAATSCGAGGAFAGADELVKFAPDNTEYILQWMDNTDNWGSMSPPVGDDFELRGDGFTPLAGSMLSTLTSLSAIKAADAEGSCRPYRVILVTDGGEDCGGDAAGAAAQLNAAGIQVYAVGFADESATDTLNAIANSGGTNQAYFVDESDQLAAAITDIVSKTVLIEKCNGVDDNCNGEIDEGFNVGATCDNGEKGACFRQGSYICTADGLGTMCNAPYIMPGNELDHGCNGIDDDCDGVIDNGLQCAGCGPEICNGRDDDCNGLIDDGPMPGVGLPCGIDVGECHPGTIICSNGHLVCSGNTNPTPEICDGKDNDCDGVIDDITRQCYDFPTGCMNTSTDVNNPTYTCMGQCIPGYQTCTAATEPGYGACMGELGPMPELCNGLDDNCDGQVDEDFPMLGMECERGQGLCHTTGHYICSPDGTGEVCDAIVVTGVPEICNGVDDNCDGIVDNLPDPPPAPIGEPCGSCGGQYVCQNGTIVCQGGAAQPEVCNGKDDNCDGLIDNPPPGQELPGVGDTCVPRRSEPPRHPALHGAGRVQGRPHPVRRRRHRVPRLHRPAARAVQRHRRQLRRHGRQRRVVPGSGRHLHQRLVRQALRRRRVPLPGRLRLHDRGGHAGLRRRSVRRRDLPDGSDLQLQRRHLHGPLHRRQLPDARDVRRWRLRRLLHDWLRDGDDLHRGERRHRRLHDEPVYGRHLPREPDLQPDDGRLHRGRVRPGVQHRPDLPGRRVRHLVQRQCLRGRRVPDGHGLPAVERGLRQRSLRGGELRRQRLVLALL